MTAFSNEYQRKLEEHLQNIGRLSLYQEKIRGMTQELQCWNCDEMVTVNMTTRKKHKACCSLGCEAERDQHYK